MLEFRIVGIEEQVKRLTELGKLKMVKAALLAAAVHIKGKISVYPPATHANQPGSGRWYERGYGVKWMTRSGVHGRKTSETLGRKWTATAGIDGLSAKVGNNVSYAPYVHADDMQASFHKARGWKTDAQILREEGPEITKFVQDAIQDEINKTGG